MEDKQLVTRPKGGRDVAYRGYDQGPPQVVNPERELDQHYTFTDRDFYTVSGGKRVPSARIVAEWARQQELSSEIIEYGKDKERAWAKVRAWAGPRDNPTRSCEKVVVHIFSQLLSAAVFEAIANGMMAPTGQTYESGKPRLAHVYPDWEIGPDNAPVLLDRTHQFQLLKNLLEKTRFAERDAVGKAERAAFLELLGKDDDVGDDAPTPAVRTPEPKTLEDFRKAISSILKKQAGGDITKAAAALFLISDVAGEHKAVRSTLDITKIDHAEEIYRRLQASEMAGKMADQPDQAEPDFGDLGGDDTPAA